MGFNFNFKNINLRQIVFDVEFDVTAEDINERLQLRGVALAQRSTDANQHREPIYIVTYFLCYQITYKNNKY